MYKLRLLGSLDLQDEGGTELRLLRQPKRMSVLAFLAASEPGAFHRRDRLLALFWPESSTKSARHGLRQALYELRKELGDDAVLQRGVEEIALNRQVVACDLTQLESAIAQGRLEEAMELYRGPLLEAFFVPRASGFMDWLDRRRAEVRRLAVDTAWHLVELRTEEGDVAGALDAARRAVQWSPTDEVGVRRLISLLHEGGDHWEALRVYDRLANKLATEFEGVPSAETSELIARVQEEAKRSESAGATASTTSNIQLQDLPEVEDQAGETEVVPPRDPPVPTTGPRNETAMRGSRLGRLT